MGHAHEDVDALFSVVLAQVLRRRRFHTPEDLVNELRAIMPRIFENKPEAVSAFELNHVYDFDRWLDEQGSHLYNAYVKRDGVDAPHSFLFKRRHDLTAHTGRAEMSQDPPSGRFDIAWRRFGKGESVGGQLSCADNNTFIAAPPLSFFAMQRRASRRALAALAAQLAQRPPTWTCSASPNAGCIRSLALILSSWCPTVASRGWAPWGRHYTSRRKVP